MISKSAPQPCLLPATDIASPINSSAETRRGMQNRAILTTLFIFAIAVIGLGQGRQAQSRQYNPAAEVTVSGVVEDVFHPTGKAGSSGTHFNLKTDNGIVEVHAGPQWFIDQQGFSLQKGTNLSVTGSKLVIADKETLIARELKNGDKILTLRDPNGIPKWSRASVTGN